MKQYNAIVHHLILLCGLLIALISISSIRINQISFSSPAFSISQKEECGNLDIDALLIKIGNREYLATCTVSLPFLTDTLAKRYIVENTTVYSVNEKQVVEITLNKFEDKTNSIRYCTIYYFPLDSIAFLSISGQFFVAPASSYEEACSSIQKFEIDVDIQSINNS